MIYNFLSDYLSIIIFLFIALFLSIGFIYEWEKGSVRMGIKMNLNSDKQKQIPEEFKDLAKDLSLIHI